MPTLPAKHMTKEFTAFDSQLPHSDRSCTAFALLPKSQSIIAAGVGQAAAVGPPDRYSQIKDHTALAICTSTSCLMPAVGNLCLPGTTADVQQGQLKLQRSTFWDEQVTSRNRSEVLHHQPNHRMSCREAAGRHNYSYRRYHLLIRIFCSSFHYYAGSPLTCKQHGAHMTQTGRAYFVLDCFDIFSFDPDIFWQPMWAGRGMARLAFVSSSYVHLVGTSRLHFTNVSLVEKQHFLRSLESTMAHSCSFQKPDTVLIGRPALHEMQKTQVSASSPSVASRWEEQDYLAMSSPKSRWTCCIGRFCVHIRPPSEYCPVRDQWLGDWTQSDLEMYLNLRGSRSYAHMVSEADSPRRRLQGR